MKIKVLLTFILMLSAFVINAQTDVSERAPLTVMYKGEVEGKTAELFLSADFFGATRGFLKIDGKIDSLRYGAYEEEGKVSLDLKSGKEIVGTHANNNSVKVKLIDGKTKTKMNLTAVKPNSSIEGTYKAKEDSKYNKNTGFSCYSLSKDELFINAFWQLASAKKGYGEVETIVKKTNETATNIYYQTNLNTDDSRPEFNQIITIEQNKKSGELSLSVRTNLSSLLGPLKSGEQLIFIKK